jgi:hypothetical protein
MIYILTEKEASLKTIFPKNANFVSFPLSKHSPNAGSLSYIDVSGIPADELKKTLTQIKKVCKDASWGIIDPKGNIKDPAVLFFEGASDYLGPVFFKDSIAVDAKRIKEVLQWRKAFGSGNESAKSTDTAQGSSLFKSGIKLPAASIFPGWNKMQTGKAIPLYLIFCSFEGKTTLDSRVGEKVLAQVHKRFTSLLNNYFDEADGLLWIDSGKDCLFIIPPRIKNAEAAIKACMRMIVSAPQLTLETLGLTIPINFTFALHYGSINYKPPGKTGTVVSDAVNSVFHLGAKKAEPGRLVITSELPDGTIPKSLEDCFVPAGEYEGRKVWHTKKFSYVKPWV